MKYGHLEEGEWEEPIRKGFKLGCCDCGLVHDVDFRIKNGKIQFRVYRNERSTSQIRRYMKKKKK